VSNKELLSAAIVCERHILIRLQPHFHSKQFLRPRALDRERSLIDELAGYGTVLVVLRFLPAGDPSTDLAV